MKKLFYTNNVGTASDIVKIDLFNFKLIFITIGGYKNGKR